MLLCDPLGFFMIEQTLALDYFAVLTNYCYFELFAKKYRGYKEHQK
jgi:hypothetical protein